MNEGLDAALVGVRPQTSRQGGQHAAGLPPERRTDGLEADKQQGKSGQGQGRTEGCVGASYAVIHPPHH